MAKFEGRRCGVLRYRVLTSGAELERIAHQAQAAAAARQAAREAEEADGLEAEDMTDPSTEETKPKVDPSYSEVVL